MESKTEQLSQDSFLQFNQSRELLAQQFYEIIGIVGNQVFQGQINTDAINLLEEINRQVALMDMEKNILRQLLFYANTLLNSKFLLGVLGRFKSGKSTILNALSGADISPMDTRISTGVLNFTYFSDQEECVVVYDNGQEMPIVPEDKVLYVDFRHNPDNEKGIHSVRHGSPNLDLQREIIFVDTPGLEAVNQIHEKITLDFVSQCHAAVIVSTYPPFGLTELQFYDRIKGKIPNIFLVQNLPADKLVDWIKLETQTLENLHKLGFYIINAEVYGNQDVRSILRQITDAKDEEALLKFKQVHNIHLYSIDAKTAYQTIVWSAPSETSEAKFEQLRGSRFNIFKRDLYEFLTRHKGRILLDDYVQKGTVMLRELILMVQNRQDLLRKGLHEIEQQIKEQSSKQQQANMMINMLMDRTTLQIMDAYRKLKNEVMDQDLAATLQDLNQTYGQLNIFRLHGTEIKSIKLKVADFNRLVGQRFQTFLQQLRQEIQNAQEQIAKAIENHGVFSRLEIQASFDQLSLGEISGAGYINTGFEVAFRGGLAYIFGSIAGGSGIALLAPLFGPTFAIFIGAAIGLGVSVPLSKYCSPALEYCKNLLSKVAHRPAQTIFERFRSDVRERLDQIERTVLDPAVHNFKTQVTDNTNKYFEVFTKRLQELHNRKTSGMSQQVCEQECQKLQVVVEQLQALAKQFESKEEIIETAGKVKNWVRGVQGYLKKFGK